MSKDRRVQDADVIAYPPAWRAAAAGLKVVARASLLVALWALLFSENPPTNPLHQIRLFCGLFAAPELAAWCIARAFAGRVRIQGGCLALELRDRRIEVPLAGIAAIEPWWLPLPRSGLWLRLRSGRRLARALAVADAVGFADALADAGASAAIRPRLDRPMAVFARARLANPPTRLDHPVLKFVVWSLVITVPVFRLHQFIAYGGAFGEYYSFGLKAYLLGFALWWASWSFNLLLYAAAIRAVVEVAALAAALAVPSYAFAARRGLEVAQRLLYYLGVPAWLALRLLA